MRTTLKNLAVFASLFFATGCQKNNSTPTDLSKVTVTFNSPGSGQVFHKGDTVSINCYITYISEMKGIGIQVIDTASGNVLFEDDFDLHTDHFTVNDSWADTVSDSNILQLKVSAFVASNTSVPAVRLVYFKVLP